MIYIIGVDHKIQSDGIGQANEQQCSLFSLYLEEIIKIFNIDIIVEESNEDALNMSMAKNCVARNIADKLKLKHIFCEPTMRERRELGIPKESEICDMLDLNSIFLSREDIKKLDEKKKDYFPVRENFWFEQIVDFRDKDMLMIIGAEHTNSFPKVLEKYNCDYKILNNNWCLENEERLNKLR